MNYKKKNLSISISFETIFLIYFIINRVFKTMIIDVYKRNKNVQNRFNQLIFDANEKKTTQRTTNSNNQTKKILHKHFF